MLEYIVRRVILAIPTLFGISVLSFVVMKLAPGDYIEYFKWISGILLRGDFGLSFEWRVPVNQLIWDRLGVTLALTGLTLIVSWLIAIPIGVYSATHRYSLVDYLVTGLSFVGLGIPAFTIAL